MIVSFRHKGVQRLYERGDARDVPAQSVAKIKRMLAVIDTAQNAEETGLFPGWRLHRLKGDYEGFWSLSVTGNWRIIFRFDGGDASELDFVDYH